MPEELKSLNIVLEMKTEELKNLRAKTMELERKVLLLFVVIYYLLLCYFCLILKYSHILVYGIMLSIVHNVYFCSLLTFYPKNKEKIGKKRSDLKLNFIKLTFFLSFFLFSLKHIKNSRRRTMRLLKKIKQ